MSVINKMLRDLDSRSSAGPSGHAVQDLQDGVRRGTSSVSHGAAAPGGVPTLKPLLGAAAVALALLAGVVAWWWFSGQRGVPVPGAQSAAAARAAVSPTPVPVLLSEATPADNAVALAATVASPVAANPQRGTQPAVAAALLPTPAQAPVMPMLVAPAAPVPPAPLAALAPGVLASAPHKVEPAAPREDRPAVPAAPPRPVFATWQEAAQETLVQAQNLWNTGARESAAELVVQALAGVERAHPAEMSGPASAVVLALLRESVRMELAQGQYATVLAQLKRYERVAVGQPDLWGLRGNAAQRLGQHSESAQAYQMALRLRPGEPRWMLGAAVSLAALGQLAAAAEMADQARALTVISPDVLAYLRQAGVPLRER
ncbi:MAG: tetratricopeptide repeat protein [Rhodoferax sp.]|nr:tetratricopeptide repeat protein [Rhodoferax sp.]